MLKCLECGHIFEDGEQAVWEERHGLDTPPYEQFDGCPICKGAYEKTKPCKHCGSEKLDDELYEGWCEDCLREQITYDTFFDYCEANKDEHYLDIFAMSEFLGMDITKYLSYDFHQLIIWLYGKKVEEIQIDINMFGKSNNEFLGSCIRFIMDDDGSIGRDNFADWLNKREVK